MIPFATEGLYYSFGTIYEVQGKLTLKSHFDSQQLVKNSFICDESCNLFKKHSCLIKWIDTGLKGVVWGLLDNGSI